jgi:hypothetical protein
LKKKKKPKKKISKINQLYNILLPSWAMTW